MLEFLRSHPYVFAVCVALLTATLTWLYARTLEQDKDKVNKTFNKTLAAGLLAGLLLTWLVHRQETICTEPFSADS